ncbi:VWA domain-containing protein [Bacillus aerolatus]|uniref:VWA domain-containing protein n=1 Tax=Bacillus aerolatus TaxID=2653354 RepID=A0A6I1FGN5_9BACI|nr:S-layer homology domain-containing protein [Bacillus aerolatus]KAB7707427.1 VWA domain-containing protein [Bacillus aerolatus]
MTVFKKRTVCLLLILLLMASALVSHTSAASLFKDVRTDHWAYPSIEWAVKKGLVKGYSNGTYAPQRALTEAEFITMLIRYDCTNKKLGHSQGTPDEHWASDNYRYLKSKNIPLAGYSNIKLRDQPITRGQVARIVAAFEGIDLSEPYAVQYMYIQNLSSGMTGKKDYNDYGVNRSLTRGEAAVFLNRLSKRGNCQMIGLSAPADGRDDDRYELPLNFFGNKTIVFPTPENLDQPPAALKPIDSRLEEVDIEKETLIANGMDSTFITLKLKDCYGNPISYDELLYFQVSSNAGTISKEDWAEGYWNEKAYSQTDGPELTVKVTAPKSSTVQQDTISFQISEYDESKINMACFRQPVTVPLTYVPKAELQVKTDSNSLSADGVTTTQVTATIVRPGGQAITDFNGRVRFRSAQGAYLSAQEANFFNGTASTTLTAISASHPVTDEIFAEIVQVDSRYKVDIDSVLGKSHSSEVVYDPGLKVDNSCPRDDLEVAFIIDSSGSMKRNDAERLRVSKSEEFISTLNAPRNIAAHFNSRGYLLSGPDLPAPVSTTFKYVFQSGGTNIGEGLEKAFNQFSSQGPKVAILLTDGQSSERKALEMIDKANDNNIKIYTIGLGDKKRLNEALLQRMASETGGQYFHVQENINIGTAYQSILNDISCGIPYPSCAQSSYVFSAPAIELTSTNFYMNTYINKNCGEIAKVVVRFHAAGGDIDYELIPRGQNYYALKKGRYEISKLDLFKEGTFLAYDTAGRLVGQRLISMRDK